jgi:hypothetical protein
MRLNSKVTWGLAWTGLAVVLAVPSVDFVTGRLGGGNSAAVLTSDTQPVETAAVTPAKTVTTVKTPNGISIVPAGSLPPPSSDPVDKMLSNGKPLPDYINDGGTAPAKTVTAAPTQVASLPEPAVAPTPFPSWARPKVTPAPTIPTVTTPSRTTSPEPVVIVDDKTLTGSIAQPPVAGPVPPAAIVDDSDNWDTETLRQYLERRGILEGSDDRSSATVTERSTTYDPNGFYLDDGPNSDRMTRETRRQRLDRLFEESGDDPQSFTLF